ncbi:hypothetical protein C1Y41_04230 [Pantoea sp. ICBG 1758]|uniref:hypothetical protein n=1 Tax=Pantoea sp. ICBG 1758 TaxID=2071682 RepID=UPI000CE4AB0F|nr:hypothetical protein [Pantoea sp. ICBG 1758]PPC63859.1 hypothetical protein C1Y41_04230 [Pantoea sp. ICBG 1758]
MDDTEYLMKSPVTHERLMKAIEEVKGGVLRKRPVGLLAGQATLPEDFDTMCQEEIEAMFYGRDEI